jgi:HYR domain
MKLVGDRSQDNRRRMRRTVGFVGIVVVLAVTAFGPAPVAMADPGSAAWASAGPGSSTLSDGADTAPQFSYQVSGTNGGWSFQTTASDRGTLTLPYTWQGFHSFFQVRAALTAVVYSNTGQLRQRVGLVNAGPANCCSSPSGGFFYSGTVSLDVQAGDRYGFELSGSNSDSARFLGGTFTVGTPGPQLQLPTMAPVEATGPDGAAVPFIASAQDPQDGSVDTVCTPASGSTFGIGSTTVTCKADASDRVRATGSFVVVVRDTTGPSLELPGDITLEATGADGAELTYPSLANDLVDGTVPVSCDTPSGSVVPLGSRTVTCTSRDSRGNTSSGAFTVVTQDTTAPVLSLPATGPILDAQAPDGAVVSYESSAHDVVNGALPAGCEPASGSLFAIGITHVSCSVSDDAGNTATGQFDVTVRGAAQQADLLASAVVGVGPGGSLASKVGSIQSAIDAGERSEALNMLRAFRNEVRAQTGKKISDSAASTLTTAANRIATVLGG